MEAIDRKCPECGEELAGGLCPRCFLEEARDLSPVGGCPLGESMEGDGMTLEAIDGFVVLGRLGEGGMGEVFRVRQPATGRPVALKWFREAVSLDRFRREVSILSRLDHPGVVRVLDAGEWKGRPYYTMDLVEGPDLAGRSRSEALPLRVAVALIAASARAVQHAHEVGVLHRDIKPQNLLLAPDGTVRVTDFGLARELGRGGGELTVEGTRLGTPSYMAPEQVAGDRDREGPATDVYGLGATLYHLLTGVPPFRADSIEAVYRLVTDAEPAGLCLLNPAVDRDLETVVLACLEKEPRRRYPDAAGLADELDRWLAGRPVVRRPPGVTGRLARWARREPVVASLSLATGLALGAGVLGTTWMWRRAVHSAELARLAEAEQAGQRRMAELHSRGREVMSGIFQTMVEGLLPLAKRAERPDALLDVWERAGVDARNRLADQPFLAAEVFRQVGENYYHAGRHRDAFRWLWEAYGRIRDLPERSGSLEFAVIAVDLAGWPGMGDGNLVELAQEALAILERQVPPSDPRRVEARLALAHQLALAVRLEEAETEARVVVEGMERSALDPTSGAIRARARQQLGGILMRRGRAAEASGEFTRALEAAGSAVSVDPHLGIYLRLDAAAAFLQAGEAGVAGGHVVDARRLAEREFGPVHPTRTDVHALEARVAAALGDGDWGQRLNALGIAMASRIAAGQPSDLEAAVRWSRVPLDHGAFDTVRDLYRRWLGLPVVADRAPSAAWLAAGESLGVHSPWSGAEVLREAMRLFSRARKTDPRVGDAWFFELACLAALDETQGFRRVCRELPEALELRGGGPERERLAKALLLLPGDAAVTARAGSLLERARPGDWGVLQPWLDLLEALTALRTGDPANAVAFARRVADATPELPERRTAALAVLALAEDRLGDRALARRHLEAATQVAARSDPWVLRHASDQWVDWAIARTLVRQAVAAVSGADREPVPNGGIPE